MEKRIKKLMKAMLIPMVLAFVLACLPQIGNAQNDPTAFAITDQMKVKPGAEDKYLDFAKNFWKPIHQERINQGKITGWILYKVLYTGTADLYNYVTVTFFDNPAKLENSWDGIDAKKILPGKDVDKAFDEILKCRDLVRSNLIMKQDEAVPETNSGATKYIQVDFMKVKPGNEGAYLDVEKNIWKPVHQEFIKAGTRAGWSLWSSVFPSGSGADYQYVTANFFSDFSKIGAADYTDAFKKAHAGKDVDELNVKTGNSRDLVRSELWEVIDSVWQQ
jgi:hypothetical protein